MAYRDCPHTPGIVCDSRSECRWCGWHPKEIERRQELIRDGKLSKGFWGMLKLRVKKKSRPGSSSSEGGKANNPNTI